MSKRFDALTALPSVLARDDGLIVARNNILYRGTTVQDLLAFGGAPTAFYVNKSGSDANDGQSPGSPFLTLTAAVTAAAAVGGRATIFITDAGLYQESLILPDNVDLIGPSATLEGAAPDAPTLFIGGGCNVSIFRVYPSVNATPDDFVSNSAILKTADGFSFINVRECWANSAGLGIASLSADGALHVHVGIIHVAAGAFGCGGGFATAFGHLHIYAGDIYLEGDGAVGVIAAANATAVTNVLGFVEHLIKRGGPYTGTVGFAALDDGGTTIGKIRMGCGTLDADTLGVEGAGCEVRVMLSDGRLLAGNTISDYLSNMQPVGEKGQADGYASLDGSGKVPSGQLPDSLTGSLDYRGAWNANTNSPTIPAASAGNKGDYYVVSVAGTTNVDGNASWAVGDWIVSNGASWDKIDNTQAVTSVAGKTGAVTLVKGDVGLGNVDNTADADKPVSTAQASAIAAKEATANKGAANGYCGLDAGSVVAVANLPGQNKGVNTQTGTPYVLVIGDAGKVIEMNNASANTLQVPPNSSVAFPIGTIVDVVQYGAGQTTISQGSGVTIHSASGNLKIASQYSGATLYKRATDEWVLIGNLTT